MKEYRTDLKLIIIDGEEPLTNARNNLNEIDGLVIREYIWPSGFIVQGPISSLEEIDKILPQTNKVGIGNLPRRIQNTP